MTHVIVARQPYKFPITLTIALAVFPGTQIAASQKVANMTVAVYDSPIVCLTRSSMLSDAPTIFLVPCT